MQDQREESSDALDQAEGAVADPSSEASELQRERDDYYDRLLRKTAEFDNYRKRIERERREVDRSGRGRSARRAAAARRRLRARAEGATPGAERRGVPQGRRADSRQLLELLRKRGVKPIDVARRRLRSARSPGGGARAEPTGTAKAK